MTCIWCDTPNHNDDPAWNVVCFCGLERHPICFKCYPDGGLSLATVFTGRCWLTLTEADLVVFRLAT